VVADHQGVGSVGGQADVIDVRVPEVGSSLAGLMGQGLGVCVSKYFLGWDRDNRVIQILGGVLIVFAVVSLCVDAFTSAHWGGSVADGCAVLLVILTIVTLNRQATRRRKQN